MDAMRTPAEPVEDPTRRHEQSVMRVRPIVLFGVGLFVLIGLTLLATGGVLRYLSGPPVKLNSAPSPMGTTQSLPPEPRLQVDPSQSLKEVLAAEEAALKSYGWVDRRRGFVRIPIDRAMELLVARQGPATKAQPR